MHAHDNGFEMIDAPDDVVEGWLAQARDGHLRSLELLRCWAYFNARRYFSSKVLTEKSLSQSEVGDLTSKFYVEFERIWPTARRITNYSRSLMRCTLTRYIGKKKRRREVPFFFPEWEDSQLLSGGDEYDAAAFDRWTETEWNRYESVLLALSESDEMTRKVVSARLASPPVQYSEIARRLRSTESALRMRMTRFYRLVRMKHAEAEARRANKPSLLREWRLTQQRRGAGK